MHMPVGTLRKRLVINSSMFLLLPPLAKGDTGDLLLILL